MLGGDRASGWDEMEGAAAVGAVAATARLGLGRRPPGGCGPRRALALLALGAMALAFAGASGAGRPGGGAQPVRAKAGPLDLPYRQVGGAMNCAQTVGTVVWLCVGPRLQALDLSDREQPRLLGQTAVLPGVLFGLVLEEGSARAWVLAGPMAVQLDISDPTQPRELARVGVGNDYDPRFGLAIAGGRLWVADGEGAVLLALDATAPKPGTMPERYNLFGAERDRIVSLAGRGDRLFLLSYRRGLGRDGSIEQNDLLVLRADESGGPILLQAQRVPGGDRARLKGGLHWDGEVLWSVIGEHLASWHPKGLGLSLAVQGTWGCSQAIGLTIHQDRLFASCAGNTSDAVSPVVVDLSHPPDFPTLAKGPEAFDHRGPYSSATAVTDKTFWISSAGGEWRGLDLGVAGSVPSLAPVGLYSGIGTPAYLAWDAPRNRLLAGGSNNARAILVGDAANPRAGPYLAQGLDVGALAVDGNRMVLLNQTVGGRGIRLQPVGDPDILPGAEARDLGVTAVETARRPFSLLGEDLVILTAPVDWIIFEQQIELWTWPRGAEARAVKYWRTPGQLLAVDQDATHVVALSNFGDDRAACGLRNCLTVTVADKRDGSRMELALAPWGEADVVVRDRRAWIAISSWPAPGPVHVEVFALDLDRMPSQPPAPLWAWQREVVWPGPHLLFAATLGISSVGDVLALITKDGQLQLLGIHADGLRPQVQVALPARVWVPDLTFNGAADAIYIAAGPAGLFELRRPTAGWAALPQAPPSATPFPTLSALPTRTAGLPYGKPPGLLWLPMLRQVRETGR